MLGPAGFDIGKDRANLIVRQHPVISRHIGLNRLTHQGSQAVFCQIEKGCIIVVPGVAGFVMRRRGQAAIGLAGTPVRLAFKIDAVAGCTL